MFIQIYWDSAKNVIHTERDKNTIKLDYLKSFINQIFVFVMAHRAHQHIKRSNQHRNISQYMPCAYTQEIFKGVISIDYQRDHKDLYISFLINSAGNQHTHTHTCIDYKLIALSC